MTSRPIFSPGEGLGHESLTENSTGRRKSARSFIGIPFATETEPQWGEQETDKAFSGTPLRAISHRLFFGISRGAKNPVPDAHGRTEIGRRLCAGVRVGPRMMPMVEDRGNEEGTETSKCPRHICMRNHG